MRSLHDGGPTAVPHGCVSGRPTVLDAIWLVGAVVFEALLARKEQPSLTSF